MESKIIYGIVVALCIVSIPSAYAEFTFDFEFDSGLKEPTDVILDRSGNNIYVVDKGSHRISVFNDDGLRPTHNGSNCVIAAITSECNTDELGANKTGDGQFNDPTSIAKDRSDTFFVVDSGNDRVQKFIGNPWEFESEFGSVNNGNVDFQSAAGIAFQDLGSRDGRIIVSDSREDSILVFDIDGKFQFKFDLNSVDNLQRTGFNEPTNMVVDDDRLYVSDTLNDRIVILDLKDKCSSGSEKIQDGVCFVDAFGSGGSDEGKFNEPRGLAFDSTDNLLYVADSNNDRIQVFETDNDNCSRANQIDDVCFVEKFGSQGTGKENFNTPIGITLDSRGEKLYVADSGNDRIQVFDLDISPSSSSSSSSSSSTGKPTNLKALPISDTSVFLSWE